MLISTKSIEKRSYIIYGQCIFKHANDIANLIAEKTIYVLMFTNKKNEDFTIFVNGSPIIQLYNVYEKIRNAISPVKINGISVYPPEFELIDIYRKLYLPNYADKWDLYDDLKVKLEHQLFQRRSIIGGKHKTTTFNVQKLLNWLKTRYDYVLIGLNAVNILTKRDKFLGKVQIITRSVEKIVQDVDIFIKQYIGFSPTFKVHNANISTEPRIEKTVVTVTLKINNKSKKIHILDIFNNAEYELIPYAIINNWNIGYPNVIKMFLLLDLWFLRILKALGKIQNLSSVTSQIFTSIKEIDNIDKTIYTDESYLGTNYELQRYKKIQGTNNEFFPYNPTQHKYIKGEYRTVSITSKDC